MKLTKRYEPINHVIWWDCKQLKANHYNPNIVFDKELQLLKQSILKYGWIQPILINPDKIIIDGFHRWKLADTDKDIIEKYGQCAVPALILNLDEPQAMLATITFNRAKGTHVAAKMSDMVKALVNDHNMSKQDIAQGIGATIEEVELLYTSDIFEAKDIKNHEYSNSWEPLTVRKCKDNDPNFIKLLTEWNGVKVWPMPKKEFKPLWLLAFYNGEAIGAAEIMTVDSKQADLLLIYITPDYRGRGFGLAFTKAIIYEAAQAGATKFKVITDYPKIYEKAGLLNAKVTKNIDGGEKQEIIGDISLKRPKKRRKSAKTAKNQS